MTLNIKPATIYPVGGKNFTDRKEAVQYGRLLKRIDNLGPVLSAEEIGKAVEISTFADGTPGIALEDLPTLIATLGDKIAEALHVPAFTRTTKTKSEAGQ